MSSIIRMSSDGTTAQISHKDFIAPPWNPATPAVRAPIAHTIELIAEMKRQNVKILLVEPSFDLKTPQSIGRETGAKVLVMSPSVGGEKEITDYIKLFDYDLDLLVAAIKETGAK